MLFSEMKTLGAGDGTIKLGPKNQKLYKYFKIKKR